MNYFLETTYIDERTTNSIVLNCTASASGIVEYDWTQNGVHLESDAPILIVSSPGNYSCMANHTLHGKTYSDFTETNCP